MDDESFIFKYIFTDGSNLTFGQRLFIVFISFLFVSIMMIGDYLEYGNSFSLEVLLIFFIFFIPILYPFVFYEKFAEKYGGNSKLRVGVTYQYYSRYLSLFAPGGIAVIILIGQLYNQITKGICLSLSFIIPFLTLFFRLNLFNDSSCYLDDEIVLGYSPIHYGITSLIIGLFGIFNSFRFFYSDFNYFFICLIVILLFQLAIVNPDVVNKVLHFELRRKKGFLIFIGCFIILYLIVIFLMCGSLEFITLQIDLTPWGILRKIIIYGFSIILAIQFYKLSKKMNKKE